MKIYILFRDVPFEFGEVYDVFSDKKEAEEQLICLKSQTQHPEEFDLQEWDVECPNCAK